MKNKFSRFSKTTLKRGADVSGYHFSRVVSYRIISFALREAGVYKKLGPFARPFVRSLNLIIFAYLKPRTKISRIFSK